MRDMSLAEAVVRDVLERLADDGFLKQRGRTRFVLQDGFEQETQTRNNAPPAPRGSKNRSVPSAPRKRTREEHQRREQVADEIEEFDSDPTSAFIAATVNVTSSKSQSQRKLALQKGGRGAGASSAMTVGASEAAMEDQGGHTESHREPDPAPVPEVSLSQNSDGDNAYQKKKKRSVIKDPIHVSRATNREVNEGSEVVTFREPFPYSQ